MARKLSSSIQTWAYRGSAILVALIGSYVFLLHPWQLNSVMWLPMTIWIGAVIVVGLRSFTLKEVELDGNDLIISYYGRQTRVPLNAVSAVTGGRGGKNPIKLEFRVATDFGESIRFVPPPRRAMWAWQRHPLVAELQQLCGLNDPPRG